MSEQIERIGAWLHARGWRWADLARKLGKSDQYIYNWRQRGSIPKNMLEHVAQVFGVTVDEVLTGRPPDQSDLSESDAELFSMFKQSDPDTKTAVIQLLRAGLRSNT